MNIQYVKLILKVGISLLGNVRVTVIFANRKSEEFQKYHSASMDLNSILSNHFENMIILDKFS